MATTYKGTQGTPVAATSTLITVHGVYDTVANHVTAGTIHTDTDGCGALYYWVIQAS